MGLNYLKGTLSGPTTGSLDKVQSSNSGINPALTYLSAKDPSTLKCYKGTVTAVVLVEFRTRNVMKH